MPYIIEDKNLEKSINDLDDHGRILHLVIMRMEDNISRLRGERRYANDERLALCDLRSEKNKNARSEIKSKIESIEIKPLATAMKKLVQKILKTLPDYDRVSEVIEEIIRQESFEYYLALSKRNKKKEKLCKK